jgi:adenylate cyclase, class 2
MNEIEIKLPIVDTDLAVEKVLKLDAKVVDGRHLEDDLLFDVPERMLSKQRKLLRLRIARMDHPPHKVLKSVLTFKGTPEITDGLKNREEIECEIQGAENLREILARAGFEITFRYQKYRTIYRLPAVELDICIDETPIGNFFELEGEILRIHEFATKLGFNRDDYITQSYASLYYRWCQKTGSVEPHMLFERGRQDAGDTNE